MQLRQMGLTWQAVGDDIVVLDLDGSVYLKINSSGRLLWEALGKSCTRAGLVGTLVQYYGIDEPLAAADVDAFIADLRARQLLIE